MSMQSGIKFDPVILRFATAFGLSPRMRFDLTVSQFTRSMYFGEELVVFDADTWRPYCHVLDFSDVIHRVLLAPRDRIACDVFNAGGDSNNFTKRMIVEAIQNLLPRAKVAYRAQGGDPRNYRVDFAKIRKRLYFEPRYSVHYGIQELVSAMENGLFANIKHPESFHGNWVLQNT